jgi:hypothetical protein
MGNYFSSSQKKESIKIINEIDHVHVTTSDSEVSECVKQDDVIKNENKENESNETIGVIDNFLNEQTHMHMQPKFNTLNILSENIVYKKKNMKKKKCKKNKKKHLQ